MELQNDLVLLRPIEGRDIADRVRWEIEETEWQLWDGPWDYEGKSRETLAAELEEAKVLWRRRAEAPPEPDPVRHLEVCVNDAGRTHVGWLGAYYIDEDCNISQAGGRLTVGITLPPLSARRKGYAAAALGLYTGYLRGLGLGEVYVQTWSGNFRMIALAEKLGFTEYRRKPGLRQVRGGRYDGLTFRLDLNRR